MELKLLIARPTGRGGLALGVFSSVTDDVSDSFVSVGVAADAVGVCAGEAVPVGSLAAALAFIVVAFVVVVVVFVTLVSFCSLAGVQDGLFCESTATISVFKNVI